jgi:transposase
MDAREIKGKEIVKTRKIRYDEERHIWLVPSQSSDKVYHVDEKFVCDCPDAEYHKATCKHSIAVRYYLQILKETPSGTEETKVRLTYKQAWEVYNKAQTSEIKLFDELLKDLVEGVEEPPQDFGRPRLSMRETIFCSVQKVYSQLSSRRAASLFGNAVEREQIKHAPHFNTVSKLFNREDITPMLHKLVGISGQPLAVVEDSFAIDSSGFRTTSYNEYANQKYNLKRQHKWLKAHISVGVKTNVVTSAVITEGDSADSPQFAPLVMATAQNGFNIKEMTADKAYSSRDNLEAVAKVGGTAYIPFKSNATGKSRGSALWWKMFLYFQLNQEDFWQHYHKRSNVESTFNMIKAKLGDKLKSKNFIAQKNELLCKLIAHNIIVLIHEMHELGIKPDFCPQNLVPPIKSGLC